MRRFANGFTLIEVMIVVAIVALLAAVAIPIYLQYVNRAQVVRAHAELSAYKAPMEEYLSRGQFVVSNVELGFVQSTITLPAPNIASFNPDGSGALEVTLGGGVSSDISGARVVLTRTAAGDWSCLLDGSAASAWKPYYIPAGCH